MAARGRTRARRGLGGSLYAGITTLGGPLINLLLARRRARGREDHTRIGERRGHAGLPRPAGPLVWVHAASIGEALSVLRLIERLLKRYPALHVLVTTGTVTSARLLGDRLPERALHQFVPVDRLTWVNRFLDHWRPDAALWVESELWPNLVMETQARGIPMVLLNARMSARSFARWQRMPGFGARLMRGFSLVMAQNDAEAERLRVLGADPVTSPGNLKFAAGPLPHDERALRTFQSMAAGRQVWVASSTHEGEEEICAYAHRRVAPAVKGLLTVIVPRHPARGPSIAQKLRGQGFKVARREANEPVTAATDIYVADTLGELGLFYRASLVAFIGGSLIPHGGQNLLEPARLGAAVLYGPHMENFRAIVDEMAAKGAAHEVADAEELVKALERLLTDAALRREVANTARGIATAKDGILDAVLGQLEPALAGIAAHGRGGRSAAASAHGSGRENA
jgi:3-deoxy-D-manno-octulosonic-acid transferase